MSTGTIKKTDYLELTYSFERLPKSNYPSHLASHLAETIYRRPGRLLDVGCGRGEYLNEFLRLGFVGAGIDLAESAKGFAAGCEIGTLDLDNDPFPYAEASFEFIFSKSVIEHLRRPEFVLSECLRVLKPGGTLVIMTPSWRHQQRIFFEDFGHIKPFGIGAVSDALTLVGFTQVRVDYFYQLPVVWAVPAFKWLARATALLPLPYRPWDRARWPESVNKWIRFSKELMLLGVAVKGGV